MTIKQNLEFAVKVLKENNIDDALMKSRILLANILDKPKEFLVVNADMELKIEDVFQGYIKELANGKPLQYITNKQEFCGIDFYVDESVLIPQPDTEVLVEEVIGIANKYNKCSILDLCTGSGAIAVTLSKNLNNANIIASDVSDEALKVAKRNDKDNKVRFIKSNMFENIEDKFDIIVSNPPYIKTKVIDTLSMEVQNEPKLALDGGVDGLDFYRIIANEACKHLNQNGYLCLEIGDDQKDDVIELLEQMNYQNIYSKKDFAGNDRIIICKR